MATVGGVGNQEDTIQILATGTKAVNTIEKVGNFVGVYLVACVLNDIVAFKIQGFLSQAPKNASTETWVVGNTIYWDNTNSVFTTAPNGPAVGYAASAAGSTAAVGDVVLVQAGGAAASDTFPVTFANSATSVDQDIFVADRACKVVSIRESHSVLGGAGCVVRPRKITDTSAPGAAASGTVKELTTADIDMNAAAVNTVQSPALSATASDLIFAAGNRLALNYTGTMTALVGQITVTMQYI